MSKIEFPLHGSKYFDVREFVDEQTWKDRRIMAACLVAPVIVRVCDLLREKAGAPVTVNNWHFAKPGQRLYRSSGYRATHDRTGAKYSMHRVGLAADVKVRGLSPAQVLQIVLDNKAEFMQAGLTRVESLMHTPSWLHLDCAPRIVGLFPENDLLFFDP